jgi:hypothetical protein
VQDTNTGLGQWLAEFVRYRHEYLRGDEKGEAQIFCDAPFRAFGHGACGRPGIESNGSRKCQIPDLWCQA